MCEPGCDSRESMQTSQASHGLRKYIYISNAICKHICESFFDMDRWFQLIIFGASKPTETKRMQTCSRTIPVAQCNQMYLTCF